MESLIDILTKPKTNAANGDYIGDDGLLVCGKCGEKKQYPLDLEGRLVKVYMACSCDRERFRLEDEKAAREDFRTKLEELRRRGITDPAYLKCRFEQDDGRNRDITAACKRYVKKFREMYELGAGILFMGDVGTGKSFMACAIANALLDDLFSVGVTNLPRLINSLQSLENRQKTIDELARFQLLVIDDLGVERDTSYSLEQVYNIIDTRARSGKPLIVTTNLTLNEINNPQTTMHARIYDRILEMCPIQLKINGKSRRKEKSEKKKAMVRELLSSDDGGRG